MRRMTSLNEMSNHEKVNSSKFKAAMKKDIFKADNRNLVGWSIIEKDNTRHIGDSLSYF